MKIFTVSIKPLITVFTVICIVLCAAIILAGTNILGLGGRGVNADTQNRILPIYRVRLDEGDKRIAITFDNAWGAGDIPDILKTLKEYNAKATFFVLGTWAEKYPEVVTSIYDAGHEIANHSYAHYRPRSLTRQGMTDEITKCNAAIKNVTGQDCNIYRAPYGEYNNFVVKTAQDLGMYVIQWDVDSLDWKDEMSADAIYQRITGRVRQGSILLFHNDTNHTKDVLPRILEKLSSEGYISVTVSELIYKDNYSIDSEGQQNKK